MQKLYTPEGEALRGQPWPEYPRPLLERDSFYNLNGEWEFAAQGAAEKTAPEKTGQEEPPEKIEELKKELDDLDRIKQFVKVQAFVASAPDFMAQPAVMNGVSDLFVEVFGEKGKHARTAVAVPQLPFNIPIEAEMIVEVEE